MNGVAMDVSSYVEDHRDEFLDELVRYLTTPSVSTTGEGVLESARYGCDLVRRCGLEAELVPTSGWPAVLGHIDGPAGTPHVLIYGHYDVQPVEPLAEWISPPFSPTLRDGRIFARGSADNKGQHLAHLLAIKALLELSGQVPCSITVLLDGEEEIGSPHLLDAVRSRRDRLNADLVLWSDGPVHESGRADVVLGVRGVISFELRAQGASGALHSGNWGGVAPNPAWELVWLLSTMRSPEGVITIDGFLGEAAPMSPGEREALEKLPIDVEETFASIGTTRADRPVDLGFYERLTAPTLTINSLTCEDGGVTKTVIPSIAVATCDVRLIGGQHPDEVVDAIRQHVANFGPHISFTLTRSSVAASRTLPESPYTAAIIEGVEAGLGEPPLLVPAMGGSLPLAVFTDDLRLPCYGVPFANVDEANHAPNENLEVWRFYAGIRASAAILDNLARRHTKSPVQVVWEPVLPRMSRRIYPEFS